MICKKYWLKSNTCRISLTYILLLFQIVKPDFVNHDNMSSLNISNFIIMFLIVHDYPIFLVLRHWTTSFKIPLVEEFPYYLHLSFQMSLASIWNTWLGRSFAKRSKMYGYYKVFEINLAFTAKIWCISCWGR